MNLRHRSQTAHDLLSGPPPEVLDEIAAVWEREPLPNGLELCFVSEPSIGRAWGEVRLPDGVRVASIAASDAIAIACGDTAWA
jgi:hypothetical protein